MSADLPAPATINATDGTASASAERLTRWGERYFEIQHSSDPLNATMLGITDFDGLLGDVSTEGTGRTLDQLTGLAAEIGGQDPAVLDQRGAIDLEVLGWLVESARADAEHSLWEAGASAAGYVSRQALVFQAIPATVVTDRSSAQRWRDRLAALPDYFDALGERYRDAAGRGRTPPACSVQQAIDQLQGHLRRPVSEDVLLTPALPGTTDLTEGAIHEVEERIRPAMARLSDGLAELLAVARDDDHVGIGAVPGGPEGYAAAVARHTSTALSPEEIHRIGLDVLDGLQEEWRQLGESALGERSVPDILQRLRSDRTLRFESAGAILESVTGAMRRAEEAVPDWFAGIGTLPCVVEEIDPVEAGNAALAYYRPASLDGNQAGSTLRADRRPGRAFPLRVRRPGVPRKRAGTSPADQFGIVAARSAPVPQTPGCPAVRVHRGLGALCRTPRRRHGPLPR